jgi:hypothetical protein
MVRTQDFKEFIESLNSNDVSYLVVGGYAVAYHGYPRYTKDLDIWIERSSTNAQKMVAALDQFGFTSLGLQPADFLEPGQIIQLGYPPNRIDILTSLPGISFEESYPSRVVVLMQGIEVNFIDLDNLKRNKKASGRPQDLADLDNLNE